jgi:hypothetical protein
VEPTPPKESLQQIFIAIKNPSPSAVFEPANLGSNDKHANHYTTEDNTMVSAFSSRLLLSNEKD